MNSLLRTLKRLLLAILCLIFLLAAFLVFSIRRSFPQIEGQVRLSGLKASVEVIRDKYGVPHIYAQNRDDLYRAQGYIHAQERFWQMDFWRHTGKGRLSELFGKSQLETDQFLGMMGWSRVAEEEVKLLDEVSLSILKAYCEGVNAYLTDHQGSKLSLEHGILRITNRNYQAEEWTPLDSIVWGKVMSWDLGMNLSTETSRARLLQHMTHKQVEELFPPYPSINPFILTRFPAKPAITGNMLAPLDGLGYLLENLPLNHDPESSFGSNNWVISGNRTKTGKPLLANDPHLGAQMPSIWFQVHLQCLPQSENCQFNVAGFSMAGVPGIIIGHNQRIAWAFTNVGPDVMDLFVERVNPENPDQYEVNGTWRDMEKVNENIRFPDGTSVPVKIRYTRHGPVLSDYSKSAKNIKRTATVEMPPRYAISLRWTALDPTTTFPAIWKMNLAKNWDEFRTAASNFDVPSQNLIYADLDGNIGYQCPGKIPVRAKGDGRYPVPGWTDEYEWTGFIPFESLPRDINPPNGYFATANNALLPQESGPLVTMDWDYGWRAKRIVELIESKKDRIDVNFVKNMQSDNKNYNAEYLVTALMNLHIQEEHLVKTLKLLEDWDFQQNSDSASAALFEAFWKNLLEQTFYDDIPAGMRPGGGSRWVEVIRLLLEQPESRWWDNQKTTKNEKRDDILKEAFNRAVLEMEKRFGKDPVTWRWGDLHTVTFRNESFGSSRILILERLFNRGPFSTGGGTSVINATSWDAEETYEVTALPSMRMIVDLSDFNNSFAIHTTGQSGHPFHPHYIDMAEPWSKMEYHPMLWDRSRIQANAEGTLKLVP
ncbi:penicillin acylase family protein [bacterium]|nr:penicillin acylase family protein [bacterium]